MTFWTAEVTLRCPECNLETQAPAQEFDIPGSTLVLRCPECHDPGSFQEGPDEIILPDGTTFDGDPAELGR